MAQKVVGYIKLQIPAGKATPAPPVGPALGQHVLRKTKRLGGKPQLRPRLFHALEGRGDLSAVRRQKRHDLIVFSVVNRPQEERVRLEFHELSFPV